MMIITKMHLPRRTFLRGLGATVALPFLDSMMPALTGISRSVAVPVRRMGVFYVPNGMAMEYWRPDGEGTNFKLSRTLEPLAPFRDQLLVLSGLADLVANPRPDSGDGGGDHARSAGTFLTGMHIRNARQGGVRNPSAGISADQIAAQFLGKETQLASLELAIESVEFLGTCDGGVSCAYSNTISWRSPETPLPMENDPRALFERLFGASDSTDASEQIARIQQDRSLVDSVADEIERLELRVGPGDRTKLSEYLDSVRDVERRIQKAEEQSGRELPSVGKPPGVPSEYAEHAKLMLDLLALAYQTDLTRICTFMLGREVSGRPYPEVGVADSHHPLSHHQNEPTKLDRLGKINAYHMQQFAYLLEKLKSMPEGDGTVLDHSLLLYGTGISDSNTHFHDNLPIALLGGAAAGIRGGRHVRYPNQTPLTNLLVTILDKMGVPIEKIGDSTGRVGLLSEA